MASATTTAQGQGKLGVSWLAVPEQGLCSGLHDLAAQHWQSGGTLQAVQALTCVPQLRQGAGKLRLDGHLQGRTGRTVSGLRTTCNTLLAG